VVVVGAGAFGGWTAHELARRGARVTLVDAWGPGNVRASSGGETRVIRATYGARSTYTRMAKRALALWQQYDERWQRRFFHKTGAMWLFGSDTGSSLASAAARVFERASVDALRAEGLPFEELTPVEARRRFPQVNVDGISSVLIEHDAGYLLARRACEHVVERAIEEGAEYRQASAAMPVRIDGPSFQGLMLSDGTALQADAFVFACGPWLGSMFPDVVGALITPTRQEVHYFGTPAGDARFLEAQLPVWIDYGQRLVYGIPGNANRGFKVADDTSGPRFDPTNGHREPTFAGIKRARTFLARRFPALAAAPLVGAEVCQYEASPDSNYLIDRHPRASNVWIVGGGSGHGFKMGPAIGELMASLVVGESQPDPLFGLARFAGTKGRGEKRNDREKWT
jgi:glycine/D-amino acid oxidase-like deaminating enzyme